MSEVDYQMALVLQYRFEQELKNKHNTDSDQQLARQLQQQFQAEAKVGHPSSNVVCNNVKVNIPKQNTDSDLQLALELQQQFEVEAQVECPSNDLVYKNPKGNSSKCLVDPSWEIIDPTPDIHVLFMTFNQRFFWNSLGSVTVAWSKRMTSCAGICSYQGRGGMCTITLSEPLLKLRPRKDLVETLLHEMIHAYLFVTNNNRDRDGHGPEFHKHMYRINAEAGTNITVYHDFHDEVKFYKQHWWRCNGPCQSRKPYFGMVRRATNRAPGSNDLWWADHMKTCGGSFMKVKSPEESAKSESNTSNKKTGKKSKPPDPKNNIRNYLPTSSKAPIPKSNGRNKGKKSIYSNDDPKPNTSLFKANGTSSSSTTNIRAVADTPSSSSNNDDYSKVREHWLKKYGDSSQSGVKRPNTSLTFISPKVPRVSSNSDFSNTENIQKVECPVCKKMFRAEQLDAHLDSCLESQNKNTKECIICSAEVPNSSFEEHVAECSAKHFDDNFETDEVFSELTQCPSCLKKFDTKSYDKHKQHCDGNSNVIDLTRHDSDREIRNCPVCKEALSCDKYDIHVEKCILEMCDDIDNKYEDNKDAKTRCLACNKEITKSELNTHLEECMSINSVLESSTFSIDDDDDGAANDEEKNFDNGCYNCPFCLKLIREDEMQGHIDKCLATEECSNEEKSLLVDSLCSTDSDME